MKFSRSLQLTLSVAALMALTACGGGGESGPAWVAPMKIAALYHTRTYSTPCANILGYYGSSNVVVLFETPDGSYEQLQQNYYLDPSCDETKLDVVIKFPPAKVTNAGTFVDSDLGLSTTQQVKVSVGGEVKIVQLNATSIVERSTDSVGAYYNIVLSPPEGFTQGLELSSIATPLTPDATDYNLAAYSGNLLYWGDYASQADPNPFPTKLTTDAASVFTQTGSTVSNSPYIPE